MQSFPKPPSAKEEKEYLKRCREGDKQARNCLIEKNLRLVAYIAKKYNAGDKDMDDLISIGTIGLIKGVDSFDERKGIRLATYASRCIENAIHIFDDIGTEKKPWRIYCAGAFFLCQCRHYSCSTDVASQVAVYSNCMLFAASGMHKCLVVKKLKSGII